MISKRALLRVAFGAAVGVLLSTSVAHAAGPLGPEGTLITTSDYRIDLTQGPVLAGTRVLGLAGAYVAIAEGVDGNALTAAAPAVRPAHSFDHVDYDLGFGVTFPAAIRGNDLFNSGSKGTLKGLFFLDAAGNLQIGEWGVGLSLDYQQFSLDRDNRNLGLAARFGGVRLQVARAFFDGQFIFGLGSRGTGLSVQNPNAGPNEPQTLFEIQGANTEVGALIRPNDEPFRIGVSLRSPVFTNTLKSEVPQNASGDRVLVTGGQPIFLPSQVALPWDLNVGFASQFGGRPLNPRWVDPDVELAGVDRYLRWRARERERRRRYALERARAEGRDVATVAEAVDAELESEATLDAMYRKHSEQTVRDRLRRRYSEMERFYVLISSSLLITGPVDNAVGVESFLEGRVHRSGLNTTYSPRLGIESEIAPRWVVLRGGTYGEPTRFGAAGASPRLHGTFGFDVKLFPWTVFHLFDEDTQWRLSAATDVAKGYFGWGASIGIWH